MLSRILIALITPTFRAFGFLFYPEPFEQAILIPTQSIEIWRAEVSGSTSLGSVSLRTPFS